MFVSYHHGNDQGYYNWFSTQFSELYDVVQDSSLDRLIDSDDSEYVMRRIRESYISGTSCTFVLCGAETPWRKYVDWEIKASLDKNHGLIGVNLPVSRRNPQGQAVVPDRLYDNIVSGYALWIKWGDLPGVPGFLQQCVEQANSRSSQLIENSRPMRARNG